MLPLSRPDARFALLLLRPLTPSGVLAAGYAPYRDEFTGTVLGRAYRGSYQLRFADGIGTRYLIRLHHGWRLDGPAVERGEFWCPDAQFTRGGTTFNVEVLHRRDTLAELEGFIAELWRTMRLDYLEGPDGALKYPQQAAY